MKNLCFLAASFSKHKLLTIGIVNESNIWAKVCYIWKTEVYCWNYGPSKLLLQFIEYRLDQLNNKHTKIAVNSTVQYFEVCSQNKSVLKTWSFLVHPPQNGGPVKVFVKLNGNHHLMANILKRHEYQTFGLMKLHNMFKIWFAIHIFSLLSWNKKYFSWFFKGFQLPGIFCACNYIGY